MISDPSAAQVRQERTRVPSSGQAGEPSSTVHPLHRSARQESTASMQVQLEPCFHRFEQLNSLLPTLVIKTNTAGCSKYFKYEVSAPGLSILQMRKLSFREVKWQIQIHILLGNSGVRMHVQAWPTWRSQVLEPTYLFFAVSHLEIFMLLQVSRPLRKMGPL